MWDAKRSFLPKFKWEKMLITSIADERGEGCHEECCQSFNNFQWYWRYFGFPSTSVFFCHLLAVSSNSLCSAQCNSFNLAPAEMCSHNNDVLFQSIFLCSWPERLSRFHSVSANNNNKKKQISELSSAHLQCLFELVLGERIPIVGFAPWTEVCCGQTPPAPCTWPGWCWWSCRVMLCRAGWCCCCFCSSSSPSVGAWPGHQCGQCCCLKEQ